MIQTVTDIGKTRRRFTEEELDAAIFKIMLELGISPNLRGFKYLSDAIKIVYNDPAAGKSIVEGLYATLADIHRTTGQCIEHSIRTAIRRSVNSNNTGAFREYFKMDKCPTAKKFINLLAERFRNMEKN